MTELSYSTVVLYIEIMKIWGLLPKNHTYKPAKHLLCNSMAALARHIKPKNVNSKTFGLQYSSAPR